MGVNYKGNIVTDGLVLCLDAGDPKSYSGSGTVWADRSKEKYIADLSDGVSFSNKGFLFNGSGTALCRTNMPATKIDRFCTVIATCSLNQYGSQDACANRIITLDRANNSTKWALGSNRNGGIQFVGSGGGDNVSTVPINIGEIFQISLILNVTNYQLFKNGDLIINDTRNADPNNFGNVAIGCRPNTTDRTWNGTIYNCVMYDRLLSPEEIQQNFSAQRSRFGI